MKLYKILCLKQGQGILEITVSVVLAKLEMELLKPNEIANPFVGEVNKPHVENEVRLEVLMPFYLQSKIINALLNAHPYEEVAYDVMATENTFWGIGSGLIGELEIALEPTEFLKMLKEKMELHVIKFTPFDKKIKKIALCGGAGQFLLKKCHKSRSRCIY